MAAPDKQPCVHSHVFITAGGNMSIQAYLRSVGSPTALIVGVAVACGGGREKPTEGGAPVANATTELASLAHAPQGSILRRLSAHSNASNNTVPPSGDVNPYGVAFVREKFPGGGLLDPLDVIVANFNNASNLQGTGTTIVRVDATASPSVFFTDTNTPRILNRARGAPTRAWSLGDRAKFRRLGSVDR